MIDKKCLDEITSIQELLEMARNTQVTAEQINDVRSRIQNMDNDSSITTKEFLDRTYKI